MARRLNYISSFIEVAANGVDYRSDLNFTFGQGVKRVLGFCLHSDFPERMRYAGRMGLNIDGKQIFDEGTFAKQFARRDDQFYKLDGEYYPNGIESVGGRKMIFQYRDDFDPAYVDAQFVAHKVFIEFLVEQDD